tara:strand:+ start:1410 stop:1541 length:132 start_codon:yes stop_codon:yes gene_type:complete
VVRKQLFEIMKPDSTNSADLSTGTKTICKMGRRKKTANFRIGK